jgi:hypothetical protein
LTTAQARVRSAVGPVIAKPEAFEPQQPGDGALDDPADPAELGLVLDPAARDPHIDPATVQILPTATEVVALVGVELVRASAWPSRSFPTSPHGRVGLQQRLDSLLS